MRVSTASFQQEIYREDRDFYSSESVEKIMQLMYQLLIRNTHQMSQIHHHTKLTTRALSADLRDKVKESYNSWSWLLAHSTGLAISVGTSAWAILGNGSSAAITAVSNASQQGASSLTSYFQNRDESARSYMQSHQQLATTTADQVGQEKLSDEQRREQILREKQSAEDKRAQVAHQLTS